MTLEEDMDDRRTTCETCRNSGVGDPRDWHHYRHPYKGPWKPASSSQSHVGGSVGTPIRAPFDPVLRLALIRKGVITPDDLKAAEAEIMVTSAEFGREMHTHEIGHPEVTHDFSGRTTSGFGQ